MPAALHRTPFTRAFFLVLLIGGGTFGVGLFRGAQALSFRQQSLVADGTVVGVQTRMRDNGLHEAAERCPEARFVVPGVSGRPIDFVDEECGREQAPVAVGSAVRVRYLPSNPAAARIDTARVWRTPVLLMLAGLLLGLAGGVPLARANRRAA